MNKYIQQTRAYNPVFKEGHKMNESELSVKDKLKFMMDNADLVSGYDIEKAYYSAMSSKLNKKFDVYLYADKYGRFTSDSLKLDIRAETYPELEDAYLKAMKSSGISSDDANLKKRFYNTIKSNFYYEGKGVIRYFSFASLDQLFYILLYVCKDEIGSDYAHANALKDKYVKIIANPNSFATWIKDLAPAKFKAEEIGNKDIAIMKNGKIIVKGLSSQEEAKLAHLFKINER